MPALTPEQISFYNENGYVAPIDIFTPEEAAELRAELEALEASHPDAVAGRNRNNVHYVTPCLIALRIIPKSLMRLKA